MNPLLFTPLTIRDLTLKNRIVLSPMLTYSATNGWVNERHIAHYAKYGVGGVGLVFVESTKIDPRGCSTPADLGLWKDEFMPGMKKIVDIVKSYGSAVGIQLGHSGRKARRNLPWEGRTPMTNFPGVDHGEPWELIGPSPIQHSPSYEAPREMTNDDIGELMEAYAQGARRANECGFDVLEIHGAHGYLLHQFLSPTANKRTDRYGGSFENRMRFALEVVASVKRFWPETKPLFLRISAIDEIDWTIDHSVELCKALKKAGVDVIDCSAGGISDTVPMNNTVEYGYQVKFADAVRNKSDIMSMAVGLIVHADQAEAILQNGQADLVAIGREMLLNPNWAIDAALKLGVEHPYSQVPPVFAAYLEGRARRFKDLQHSTTRTGINAQSAAQ